MHNISIFSFFLLSQLLFSGENLTYNFVLKSEEGQKIFRKKLRHACRSSAATFAQTHTDKEWEDLKKRGKFRKEIYKLCPRRTLILKDEWMEPLYAFSIIYASNTGQFPE